MSNLEQAEELRKCGYIFRSLHNGTMLLIETAKGCVCYYPGNGFFEGAATGKGFGNLLKNLRNLRGLEG